tara:strand:- start:30 stop:206 length:177 start_codon:yes stop_codon:yes gene_type:complete
MAKSLDRVLQADGSYKWELVDSWDPSSEKSAKPVEKPAAKPATKAKTTRKTKASKVEE